MICTVSQTLKELCSATFSVLDEDGRELGHAFLQGSLLERDGEWQVELAGEKYLMRRISAKEAEALAGGFVNKSAFRACCIFRQGATQPNGVIFMDEVKWGLLSADGIQTMVMDGQATTLYWMGLGKKGFAYPVYLGDERQVAQIERPCEVKDMLYQFQVFCPDERFVTRTVLHTLYMYMVSYYETGVRTTKYTSTRVMTTKRGIAVEKYDPNFWPHD